jgi:predicted DCC family thiol-disulfide oxidoreductase YuxK
MRRLFVLYDSRCGLCSWARRWLAQQPAYLELVFIPAGSASAARLFPGLSHAEPVDELVVVGDDGAVYRSARAWIMTLYALVEYREWSLRLARPLLLPLARQAFTLLSTQRGRISRWLDLASEAEIAETLNRIHAPACAIEQPGPAPDACPATENAQCQREECA